MQLLFDKPPCMPNISDLENSLNEKFGEVKNISNDELIVFAVNKYITQFKDGSSPVQLAMSKATKFEQEKLSDIERSQLWNVKNGKELLNTITYKIQILDLMCFLDYKDRCNLLMDWLEVAVSLFPECKGIWIPSAGKLFTADDVRNHQIENDDRFVYFCVNTRLFNIQNSDEMLVDTLGMYAIGLTDVQYHFHGLDPKAIVNHAYNVASYIFSSEQEINNGETIDGLDNNTTSQDVQWKCQYEESLVQPKRVVLDICPTGYAAGNRN